MSIPQTSTGRRLSCSRQYLAARRQRSARLRRIGQRIDFVAAIHRQRAPAEKKERHVRAQAGTQFPSAVRAAISSFVRRSIPISAAAASLDPPPSPRATGIRFVQVRANRRRRTPVSLPIASIARIHQICPVRRQRWIIRLQEKSHLPPRLGARELERVVQRDRLKDSAQLVITVRAAPQHVQAEIDLRERRQAQRSLFRKSCGGAYCGFARIRRGFLREMPASGSSVARRARSLCRLRSRRAALSAILTSARSKSSAARSFWPIFRYTSPRWLRIVGSLPSRSIAFCRFSSASGELVLLVVSPAQAVEVRAVIGLLLHGPLNQRHSFVQANRRDPPACNRSSSDTAALFGFTSQHLAKLLLGLIEFFLPLVNGTEHETTPSPCPGILASHLLGLLRRLFRFGIFSAALLHLRDIEIDFLVAVIALQQALKKLRG